MRSNCLIFALALFWRRARNGHWGRIYPRRSHWGPFPHFLYEERGHIVSYTPVAPHYKVSPPLLFRGRVKWGDSPV